MTEYWHDSLDRQRKIRFKCRNAPAPEPKKKEEKEKKMFSEFNNLHKLFTINNVCHYSLFSGNGFHIVIPYDTIFFPLDFIDNESFTLKYFYIFGINLKKNFNLV